LNVIVGIVNDGRGVEKSDESRNKGK